MPSTAHVAVVDLTMMRDDVSALLRMMVVMMLGLVIHEAHGTGRAGRGEENPASRVGIAARKQQEGIRDRKNT
jgi:hypothetical protein